MLITYSAETDIRYQSGTKKGIVSLIKSGLLSNEPIAEVIDASLEHIRELKKLLKK